MKNELCLTVIMFSVAFVVSLKMNSSHDFWGIPCWKKRGYLFSIEYSIISYLIFFSFFMDSQENTGSGQKFYDKLQDVFHTCNDEQQWMRVGNVCNSLFFSWFVSFDFFFLFLDSSDNLSSIQIKTKNHSNILGCFVK